MILFFSCLSGLYGMLLLWLYWHWSRIPVFSPTGSSDQPKPTVTVVIPVRNESATVGQLLNDLAQQADEAGSPVSFEVIVVDDASTDDTVLVVQAFQPPTTLTIWLETLRLPNEFRGSHKKMALQQAIAQARGEVIVTTDGDCRVGTRWLSTVQAYFAQHQPVLLSAPVTFRREATFFERLQTIEFASLIGTGAACLRAGQPNMANGANLAFLRSAFYEVGGYEGTLHIPSGDDEFLLQKMSHRFPRRLAFLRHPAAVVRTKAQPTLREFYQQRKRWASKWKLHRNYYVAGLAVFIFAYHLSVMLVMGLSLAGLYPGEVFLSQFLPKVVLEYFFLRSVLTTLQKPVPLRRFLLLELIYAPYVVFFGMRANFGGYIWKNRSYS